MQRPREWFCSSPACIPKKRNPQPATDLSGGGAEGCCLEIAGSNEGGHLCEVMVTAQRFGIAVAVNYLGKIEGEAKSHEYDRAELFVLPTFSENFGVVVAEALALDLPVITPRALIWKRMAADGGLILGLSRWCMLCANLWRWAIRSVAPWGLWGCMCGATIGAALRSRRLTFVAGCWGKEPDRNVAYRLIDCSR